MEGAYRKGTVLLVEDDADIVEMLGILLPKLGYDIAAAENGAEALAHLRRADELPQLILLDLMMPEMDGWEFRTEQLRDPRLSRIPVVIMTGMQDPADHARALRADDYVAKPLDLEDLKAAMAPFLP